MDQILSMSARSLPPEARKQIAIHEAGHAVFFGLGESATELEVRANATSLGAFRDYVLEQSQQFLLVNRAALDRVAEALLEKGELDVEDLRRLLPGVMPAAGFDRFAWPPDVPAMQYLRS